MAAVPVLTANSPSAGYIAWTEFHISYQGAAYDVLAGNTNKKYTAWLWNLGTPVLAFNDTQPTVGNVNGDVGGWAGSSPVLGPDDLLLFLNQAGVPINVQSAQLIEGDLIATGTVTAAQIAGGTITGNKIQSGAISAGLLAVGAVTAGTIASGAVTAGTIQAGAIDGAVITGATIRSGAPGPTSSNTVEISGNQADRVSFFYNGVQYGSLYGNGFSKIVAMSGGAHGLLSCTDTGETIGAGAGTAQHNDVTNFDKLVTFNGPVQIVNGSTMNLNSSAFTCGSIQITGGGTINLGSGQINAVSQVNNGGNLTTFGMQGQFNYSPLIVNIDNSAHRGIGVNGISGLSAAYFECLNNAGTRVMAVTSTGSIQSTSTTIASTSDQQLKTQIEYLPHEGTLERLIQLKPATFEFKWNEGYTEHGLIAQDVQQVFPEHVEEDEDGMLRIRLPFQEHAIMAFREVAERLDRLEAQIGDGHGK